VGTGFQLQKVTPLTNIDPLSDVSKALKDCAGEDDTLFVFCSDRNALAIASVVRLVALTAF
jgi:hypothetical protein